MRKLFWTCMFSGVVLAGGVISTAHFAVHHPDSAIGRVLHGASHIASIVNPVIGLTPLADHARAVSAAEEQSEQGESDVWQVDPVPVPDDPVPVAADDFNAKAPEPGPIVVANSGTAPIVICEDDSPAITPPPAPPEYNLPPTEASGFEPVSSFSPAGTECMAPDSATAPQVMPYCHDEDVYELLPMPTEETQILPMPRLIEGDAGLSLDTESIDEGRLLRCIGCPAAATKDPRETIHHAVHRKLGIFGCHDDENCPEHPEIDTMEFRPSDGHLYDFGPGSL
jgi:hypothetical protein